MYEDDNNTYMEYDSEETWDNGDDPEAETDSTPGSDPTIDLEAEDFVSSGEEVVGVLDVFNKEDDGSKVKILKQVFSKSEIEEFVNSYKEEEATQAELMNDELGDDYFLVKHIENNQGILEGKEEDIAEVLNLD